MEETPQVQTETQEVQTQAQLEAEDFDIRQGMMVEALTLDNQLTFVGKVERFSPNGAVTIRESSGQELPPVLYNKEIKLRFFQGARTMVLHGKICGSTQWIWKLDQLENKFVTEKRGFFRQHVSVRTPAVCTPQVGENRTPTLCKILDVSAGGLLLSSREIYLVGDELTITDARIVDDIEPFTFHCRVRRAGERENGSIPYGCQFTSLGSKEQDRLLRAIFIAQRKEIQTQKVRGGL